MPEPILHHFPISPYAEKVRVLLGLKQLAWRSVDIPMILPKPDVVALTGGYRRTPVLQLGADIICDTALIAATLDRIAPKPPLWPAGFEASATALARHADSVIFECASVLFGQPHVFQQVFGADPERMAAIRADRSAMRQGTPPRPTPADGAATLSAFLTQLDRQLSNGRSWVLGAAPSLADAALYHPLWLMGSTVPVAPLLAPYAQVHRWMKAVRAIGHGRPTVLSSGEAIEITCSSTPGALEPASCDAAFPPGAQVRVAPTDYGVEPTAGTLVQLSGDHVVIARDDPRAGRVHVHFPRLGYRITRAD